jgi:hypothetical protein
MHGAIADSSSAGTDQFGGGENCPSGKGNFTFQKTYASVCTSVIKGILPGELFVTKDRPKGIAALCGHPARRGFGGMGTHD